MPKLNSFGLGIAVIVFVIYVLAASAQAAVIYVPDDYEKIQWAVNNATAGDMIIVRDGVYVENIDVNIPYLTLMSENGSVGCTVQAADPYHDDVFEVTANHININGFTVTGAIYGSGIKLVNSKFCNISNNICLNNYYGIYLNFSDNNVISENNCSNNAYGIYIRYSHNNTLINNNCLNTFERLFDCIIIIHSTNNSILGNNCSSNNWDGIRLKYSDNNSIINNNCFNNDHGISLHYSNTNFLLNNNCSMNKNGIYLRSSNNNFIINNKLINDGDAISLITSHSNKLSENIMMGGGVFITTWSSKKEEILKHYTHKIDTSNKVNGKPIYYWKDINGGRIPIGAGQVILVNCTDIVVENQDLSNGSVGVEIILSSNIVIRNNNCSFNNHEGIHLFFSSYSLVTGNDCLSNGNIIRGDTISGGIILGRSFHNIISNNQLHNNRYGIYLCCLSGYNKIINNDCLNNFFGIALEYSNLNKIIGNNCSNSRYGIFLKRSFYNTITKNNISHNNEGIYLYYAPPSLNLPPNIIYLNNFIENNHSAYSYYSANIWNSTKKITYRFKGNVWSNYLGNYWGDYIGSDVDGDGIGDDSYVIDSDNQDIYPLMKPIENYKIIEKWSFAIITDLHIGRGYPDYGGKGIGDEDKNSIGQEYYLTERLRKVVEWINNNKTKYNIKFVVVLGDISDSGEYSELKKAKEILDELDVPYIPVIGNHDIWPYCEDEYGLPIENQNKRYFIDIYGDHYEKFIKTLQQDDPSATLSKQLDPFPPDLQNYAFTFKGVKFIILDCVSRSPTPIGSGVLPNGVLYDSTLEWLKENLESQNKVVIFSHVPLISSSSDIVKILLAFTNENIIEIEKAIEEKNANVLANFAGHIHSFEERGTLGHGEYPQNANKEYPGFLTIGRGEYPLTVYCYTPANIPVITTEAVMVGSNGRGAEEKGIIRIVNISGTGESVNIDYNTVKGIFPALNPEISYSPKLPIPYQQIIFQSHDFTNRVISSYLWNLNNVVISGKKISHTYYSEGDYVVNLTLSDISEHKESITTLVHVSWLNPAAHVVIVPEKILISETRFEYDLTRIPIDVFTHALISVIHSNPTPVGEIFIHFEDATEDVNLTGLVADIDLNKRKSILYMPEWPEVVEKSKVLYIPSTGKGAVYICKNATSLDEVSLENADVIINVGETKNGMTVLTTYYNGREYYMVLNLSLIHI